MVRIKDKQIKALVPYQVQTFSTPPKTETDILSALKMVERERGRERERERVCV